jgi:hypothetical protein
MLMVDADRGTRGAAVSAAQVLRPVPVMRQTRVMRRGRRYMKDANPVQALRMSQLQKVSRLVSHLLNSLISVSYRAGQFPVSNAPRAGNWRVHAYT